MEEILKILKECDAFYLATIDGNRPRIRPFLSTAVIEGRLCICTGSKKAVYKQMRENPFIGICTMMSDGGWIRINAKVVDITSRQSQEAMLLQNPDLKAMYAVEDGNFTVLCIEEAEAEIYGSGEDGDVNVMRF